MRCFTRWLVGALVAAALGVSSAAAQSAGGKVVYQKKTVIDFDDDTIEGDLSRPDGEYLEARKQRKHKNLIMVRLNFRTEILQSVRGL